MILNKNMRHKLNNLFIKTKKNVSLIQTNLQIKIKIYFFNLNKQFTNPKKYFFDLNKNFLKSKKIVI